jgi:hypothetical protein
VAAVARTDFSAKTDYQCKVKHRIKCKDFWVQSQNQKYSIDLQVDAPFMVKCQDRLELDHDVALLRRGKVVLLPRQANAGLACKHCAGVARLALHLGYLGSNLTY